MCIRDRLYMEDSGSGAYEYLSAGLSKYSFIKTDMSFDEIREKIAAGEYKYAVEVLSPLKIRPVSYTHLHGVWS